MKWKKSRSNNLPLLLPPGPKKLPIIGNLHLISQPPFRCFRDLAKQYGPIMHLKLGEVDTIVVSSPEIAREILKDSDPAFAARHDSVVMKIFSYNYLDIVFGRYGDYWRQMRKICTAELLSARNVRSFGSIRKDEVSRLVESLRLSAGSRPVNLSEEIFSMMSSITSRAAFGLVACKDKHSLIRMSREGIKLGAGFVFQDHFPSSTIASVLSWGTRVRILRMRRHLDLILDDIIRQHERNLARIHGEGAASRRRGNGELGNEDLIDVLLRIKENGEMEHPISYDNIKALLYDLFTGGTDTSSSTVEWVMTELLRNPQVMAKAQAEVRQVLVNRSGIEEQEEDIKKLHYLKLVIMETHRLHPQGSLLPRASREQRQIRGYTIPEKARVLVNVWEIHRDPKYWIDPESFEPERFRDQPTFDFTGNDFRYLPFGSGKRICPGIAFASASVVITLAHLLYHFDWKLPPGVRAQDLNMIEDYGITTSRRQNLIVVATPFKPSL
ncbi:hypothetical protein C2S51_013158 [Perilla frutescens var. frutescens]|nr:hypothetical protein C2S51_013158 [Perilla frutescens var. frutescens]